MEAGPRNSKKFTSMIGKITTKFQNAILLVLRCAVALANWIFGGMFICRFGLRLTLSGCEFALREKVAVANRFAKFSLSSNFSRLVYLLARTNRVQIGCHVYSKRFYSQKYSI